MGRIPLTGAEMIMAMVRNTGIIVVVMETFGMVFLVVVLFSELAADEALFYSVVGTNFYVTYML